MWICQKTLTFLRKYRYYSICILFLVFINMNGVIEQIGHARELEPVDKHIVVVFVPGLSFDELDWMVENTSHPSQWSTGAVTAVNVKPDGQYSYLNNMVSISTGKRAVGIVGWNAFEGEETINEVPVENLFLQWHGKESAGSIIHPHVHIIQEKNNESSFKANVGWLGESLKNQGVHTYVVGNSDLYDEKIRYAPLTIMDEGGFADGDLHSIVVDNVQYPSGKQTDPDAVAEQLAKRHALYEHTLVIVEWGDIYRLYSEQSQMTQEHFAHMYKIILRDLDDAIQRILETDAEVWLMSPSVNKDSLQQGKQLAPLWIWKEGREDNGHLFSPTTRRSSIVSNTDISATWLAAFSSEADMNLGIGQTIQFINNGNEDAPYTINKQVAEMNHVFTNRGAVLSSYVSSLVVMLVIVSLMIWLLEEANRWKRLAHLLLLSGVLSPLWFLITAQWIIYFSAFIYVLIIMVGSFANATLLERFSKEPFSIACFLFFLALILDVSLGSYLTQRSFLSYDPVIGARYYGIGNEYAGIVLVSGILMMAPIYKRMDGLGQKSKIFQWAILGLILFMMIVIFGMSVLGANAGASLSAGAVFLFVTLQHLLRHVSLWIKVIGGCLLLFVLLFVLFILQISQPASHIAIAFQHLLSGDLSTIGQTIVRKLSMNWKIFKISYWTQLFLTSYFLIGVVLWKRRKSKLNDSENFLINCCITGSLALLLLNDSGIVAAATSMFITLCVCYGWSLHREKDIHM